MATSGSHAAVTSSAAASPVSRQPASNTVPHRKRVFYLDFMRVVAMVFVVNIHESAHLVLNGMNQEPLTWWITGDVLDAISRWCVPIFIMISGHLMLNKARDERLGQFLKKRLWKVGVPLVAWSLFYALYRAYTRGSLATFHLHEFLVNLAGDQVYFHLWFLYTIFGLYLIVPMLHQFVMHASNHKILYIIIILFGGYNLSAFSKQFFGVDWSSGLFQVSVYAGYFLLGAYLVRINPGRAVRGSIYAAAAILLLASIVGTYFINGPQQPFDEYFYQDPGFANVFISTAVFLFCKTRMKNVRRETVLTRAVYLLSNLSLGIYLIHPLFLNIIHSAHLNAVLFGQWALRPIIGVPLVDALILAASGVTIYILQKIPVVRLVVP